MAIITWTEADLQRAQNPFDSGLTLIGFEETPNCIGEDCSERIFLSREDQEKYGVPTIQEPMGPHCHIVVAGQNPLAGPWRYPIFSK